MKKSTSFIIILVLLIFFGMILANSFGYYESTLNKKTILTNERIKEFEEDIRSGNDIDLTSYLETNTTNYDNKASELGLKVSRMIENTFNKGMKFIFKKISKMVEE